MHRVEPARTHFSEYFSDQFAYCSASTRIIAGPHGHKAADIIDHLTVVGAFPARE